MKHNILILLTTYNSRKYIREQLDSLYAQQDVRIDILVRDDCSTDDTLELLRDYKEKNGKMTILPASNAGAAYSFHILAHYALTEMQKFDYYSFCDRDDVWLKNKLYISCISLDKTKALYKFFQKIKENILDSEQDTFYWMMLASVIMYPALQFNPTMFRLHYYYSIAIIVVLPYLLQNMGKFGKVLSLAYLSIAIYYFFNYPLSVMGIVPYQFFFE